MKNPLAALLIFFGSFLSFFVQPLVGRTLLPYFGGSAAVWVTCLVVFQFLLLVGYGYAFLPARGRRRTHLALVFCAAALAGAVPILKGSVIGSLVSLHPAFGVFLAVLSLSGLVSVVLSANSTVVQSWIGEGREVYHLYAISNAGSLAGLLAYPLLVEPFVAVPWQWAGLGAAIAAYGAGLAAIPLKKDGIALRTTRPAVGNGGAAGGAWLWFALPAVSCGLMTSATTYLTADIVALPLVWAVLLSAFLVSYIIGFSRIGERFLPVWMTLAVLSLAFAAWSMLPKDDTQLRFHVNAAAVLLLLLVVCSAFHSWLFAIRPEPGRLPHFYFAIALGGCLGGILSGILPPLVFNAICEYPIALAVSCGAVAHWVWRFAPLAPTRASAVRKAAWTVLALIAAVVLLDRGDHDSSVGTRISRMRDFYGVVAVERQVHSEYAPGKFGDLHLFRHGKTLHGAQLMAGDVRRKPTVYYSLNGGGIPFATLKRRPLRVAVVGMGVGTLVSYGKAGDYFRLYEISPEVINMATNAAYFSFLADCPSEVEIVEGDARIEMQKDVSRGVGEFDIVAVDVYSGDSVPGHLVTKEAFELFKSVLKDDGVLAFHISNWHVDLYSVMKAAARHLDMNLVETLSGAVRNEYASETAWAFMTNGKFEPYMPNCCRRIDLSKVRDIPLMTDECGSLIFNIRLGYYPEFID